jgi:small subunit ribosomal protein S4e
MKKQHLSRLAAPRSWPIHRKLTKWITKPAPGTHNLVNSIPLIVLFRDILGKVDTVKGLKQLLNAGIIFVNNRKISKANFAVGLFDVVSIKSTKEYYRVVINKRGKFALIKTTELDSNILLLRIKNKKTLPKNKVQINFTNGWNLIVKKDEYKTNEVVLFNLKDNKIVSKIAYGKNAIVYVIGGKHVGIVAKFISMRETGNLRKDKIIKMSTKESEFESSLNNVFVVGEGKPAIKVE